MITEFEDYITYVKQYSIHTVAAYIADLRCVEEYLTDTYRVDVLAATKAHLRSYVVHLRQSGLAAKSINRKISTLKSFYVYLKRRELVKHNPASSLVSLKVPKRLPSFVEVKTMSGIRDDMDVVESWESLRDLLVISLLYSTGIRRSELIAIRLPDIDKRSHTVRVQGKGGKERLIPYPQNLNNLIDQYLDAVYEALPHIDHDYLLHADSGKPAYPKLIYNIVNRILSKYNASSRSSPHTLRHSYATHLLENGADLNAIKELLGHASLAATQVYTHNSIKKLKDSYSKAHPRG